MTSITLLFNLIYVITWAAFNNAIESGSWIFSISIVAMYPRIYFSIHHGILKFKQLPLPIYFLKKQITCRPWFVAPRLLMFSVITFIVVAKQTFNSIYYDLTIFRLFILNYFYTFLYIITILFRILPDMLIFVNFTS